MLKQKMFTLAIQFLACLALIMASFPACIQRQRVERFQVNEYSLWSGDKCVWASVSVRDPTGRFITGLTSNDFKLTEALISPTGEVLQERGITFDKPDYQFDGEGFWERSVTDEKLDIIFVIDSSGSMADKMPGIHSELHEFVNRLLSLHTDFRMAVMKIDSDVVERSHTEAYNSWAKTMSFRGMMESREIRQWLDNVQPSWGESLLPAASYDQLMLAGRMDFRKEARKVVVVITDTIAHNIYGPDWHPVETTAACLSGVELFFKNKGIEILYSQPDEKETQHLKHYTQPHINPRAKSGFETLGKSISWPFRQEDIRLAGGKITQSQYFFAWMSQLKIPASPKEHKVKVGIKTPDFKNTGEFLDASFYYAPYEEKARLVIKVSDEEGNPVDDLWFSLKRQMGDRKEYNRPYSQLKPRLGNIVLDNIPVGKYHVGAVKAGNPVYRTTGLRYILPGRIIEVPPGGLEISLRVETEDRDMELAKARGLLRDLDNWRSPGDPFAEFAAGAEKWLDEVEKNGVSLREMVVIKRFYVALSGYANLTEYSQLEMARATENLYGILEGCRNIMKQIKAFYKATELSWEEVLAEIGLDIITMGGATEARLIVEKCLHELIDYAESKLLPELIKEVMKQIPNGDFKPFIDLIINTCLQAEFDSWDAVMKTGEILRLDQAVEEVRRQNIQMSGVAIFSGLKLDTPLQKSLVNPVSQTVASLFQGGLGKFGQNLGKFARDISPLVQKEGREKVGLAVAAILEKARQKLEPGDARDFLVGMAGEFILQAIPGVKGKPPELEYSINSDDISRLLFKYCLNYIVFKEQYVDKARLGMNVVLQRAQNYQPRGKTPDDWEREMREWDFFNYRSIMRELQDYAWDSLAIQKEVRDWYQGLQGLVEVLKPLAKALTVLGNIHPAFEEIAVTLGAFTAALDGIKIIPRAIEFGLQIQALDKFGDSIEPLYQAALPAR